MWRNWAERTEDLKRRKIEAWRADYSRERPDSSMGYRLPEEVARLRCPPRGHAKAQPKQR